MTGKVRALVENKGYGFIEVAGGRDDYFFHRSDTGNDWDSICIAFYHPDGGATVEFDANRTPKGLRASNVRIMGV